MNNVGHMYEYPDELANVPSDIIWSKFSCFILQKCLVHDFDFSIVGMILTNVGAVTMMSRLMVNDMKKRMKGIIVNISSFAALQPLPYGAAYAATKVIVGFIYEIILIGWWDSVFNSLTWRTSAQPFAMNAHRMGFKYNCCHLVLCLQKCTIIQKQSRL